MTKKETMGFQTEVNQILNLVIHSLYSNKEIFLRELISNASDALDKLRFLALSNGALYENDSDLKIKVSINTEAKTITIQDNGIGMTWDEVVSNLGTIAKSGTKEFLSQMTGDEKRDSHLIGQFGVGFYSAFIVADKVIVKTRKAGVSAEEGVVWESKGDGEFSIKQEKIEARGTQIILHIKKEDEDFLSDWRIKSIIHKYSDHICWPIAMKTAPDEENKTPQDETINKATALWTQNKSEISDEDYKALYKHISHDYEDPMTWSHNQVEGKHEYTSLLYIPNHAPFDLWAHESKHGIKLYVKRVFIMDDAQQFLPRYLRFIKGIVDANDLPLNVSREILQDNKLVETIRSANTKRILSLLDKMASAEPEQYQQFWKNFGLVLKEGTVEDTANRDSIAKLLRFSSTANTDETQNVSLADYIGRMKEGQDKIYYVTAPTYNAARFSPHLEIFKKKGIEVLLLTDKVDEWLVSYLSEFEGKKLQSISKGKIELPDDKENEEAIKAQTTSLDSVLKHMKEILGEKVKAVVLTSRLTDSPSCVVADEGDMGLEMQRILKAAGQTLPPSAPILELNPNHPLIEKIKSITDDERFKEWTLVLFDQAMLAEGGELTNPAEFIARVNQLLIKG